MNLANRANDFFKILSRDVELLKEPDPLFKFDGHFIFIITPF